MTAGVSPMGTRRAKIVATLGPATDGLESGLVTRGLDVARLNFSHGTREEHERRCRAVRTAAADVGRAVAVMQDLQGPKIRVGRLPDGPIQLVQGQPLTIESADVPGDAHRIGCTYEGLAKDVTAGDTLLLDDGRLRLRVEAVRGNEVLTRIEVGGLLSEHKGINLPGIAVSAPALTAADRENLEFGLKELDVDYVALSFVRGAGEVQEARALIRRLGYETPLIVKLEKPEAIADLDAIIAVADGVMVARGDLAVELQPEQVPLLQKKIIYAANARGIPVITATQMLESMITEETPTRAEANDVANAVWDGSDAVMLSGETAVGRHPLLVLEIMDRIVRAADAAQLPPHVAWHPGERHQNEAAVTHAACVLAEDLGAVAVVGVTRTGQTARLLSRGRSGMPVYAFSPDERVCRRLALWRGVTPILHPLAADLEDNVSQMEAYLLEHGAAQPGDIVVIAGSFPFRAGAHTNFVRYQVLGAA